MRTRALKSLEAQCKRPCRFYRCDDGWWSVTRPSWMYGSHMIYTHVGIFPTLAAAIAAIAKTQE